MGFEWLNKQGVRSSDGYAVQSVGRYEIEYREGSSIISIEVDPGIADSGQSCLSVNPSSFERWVDGLPIEESKQSIIRQRFKDAMRFQDIEVVFYP